MNKKTTILLIVLAVIGVLLYLFISNQNKQQVVDQKTTNQTTGLSALIGGSNGSGGFWQMLFNRNSNSMPTSTPTAGTTPAPNITATK